MVAVLFVGGNALAGAPGGGGVDHFLGYPNNADAGADGPIVQIQDQFGQQQTDLEIPIRFLVPADKNDEGLFQPFGHLTCYGITDGNAPPAVISTNQFGAQPLTLHEPDSLCVPTVKLIAPGSFFLDHYTCYRATGTSVDASIVVRDQFQINSALVTDPRLFCAPAVKNGEGSLIDPVIHLTCYDVTGPSIAPGSIHIQNQFVDPEDILDLEIPDLFCAPSLKQIVAPLDHFTLYDAVGPDGPVVSIDDQFGPQDTDLGLLEFLMVPADKNGEGISDFFSHLTCYDIVDGDPGPTGVTVTNQFVTDEPIAVGNPEELCVPTEKLITPGPVDIDHFKCYEVAGDSISIGVGVVDQFQSISSVLGEPIRLCNPADKNGEGIQDPENHLVCYELTPPGDLVGPVPITNQFVVGQDIGVGNAIALCVPSLKMLPEPSLYAGLASGLLLLQGLRCHRRRRSLHAPD